DISLEGLPASLEGLRIAHLTDTHITRPRPRFERLVRQLARLRLDLVVMTGDYTANPGHEAAAVAWMEMLTTHVKPAHGIFAVLGNHDSRALVGEAAHLPITFLSNASQRLPGLPIEIMGLELTCSQNPDSVALLLSRGVDEAQE